MTIRDHPLPLLRRLHFRTWVVTFLVGIVLLLANVPGKSRVEFYPRHDAGELAYNAGYVVDHGWPVTYLTRRNRPWQDQDVTSLWRLKEDAAELSVPNLVSDVVVCVVILALVQATTEWCRRRTRRSCQLSLRGVFVGLTLVGTGCGWCVLESKTKARLERCVAKLDGYSPFGGRTLEPGAPEWLRDLVGNERLEWLPVTSLFDYECEIPETQEELECLQTLVSQFPSRVRVTIHQRLSDQRIAYLSTLTEVQWLELWNAEDRTLSYIAELKDLRWLAVHGAWTDDGERLSNDGLAHLRGLGKLRTLHLGYFKLSDEGIGHLQQLDSLEVFGADYGSITERGVQRLTNMRKLRVLTLPGNSLTDGELMYVTRFRELRCLRLRGCRPSERMKAQLQNHPKLVDMEF